MQASGGHTPCSRLCLVEQRWLGAHRAGTLPSAWSRGLCRAGPRLFPGEGAEPPSPGCHSQRFPSPSQSGGCLDGEAGSVSFVCHLAGKERRFGGRGQRDRDRGTGGPAESARPRKGDRTCTSSVPLHGVTALAAHLCLLLLLPFFAPACWHLSFTGHYIHT